jgi:non-canonical purine NTP pyrophosphatase (RdgB/HAM1 family)
MSIFFITSNKGKFDEAKKIVPELEMLDLDLPEEQEVDQQKIIESKPEAASKKHFGALVVEDTGFYLDCLPGLPGPLIKWFLKTIGRKGLYEICKRFENYRATGITIVGLQDQKGDKYFFKGEVSGNVVLERGEDGFGWDPVFIPEGEEQTFAEMSREEKNEISMRRKAFEELRKFLDTK